VVAELAAATELRESRRLSGSRRPLPGIRIRRAEHDLAMDWRDRRGHRNRQSAARLSLPVSAIPWSDTRDRDQLFYFWSAPNGYRQNDPEATEQLYREIAPTFLEDKEMVEAQQRRFDEFGERGLVDIASDAKGLSGNK
jgi:hypothetical protein